MFCEVISELCRPQFILLQQSNIFKNKQGVILCWMMALIYSLGNSTKILSNSANSLKSSTDSLETSIRNLDTIISEKALIETKKVEK